MAWRWRIRHKLLLGLGLVVGIIALLLAGTLKGLLSYSSTMKSIESKMVEMQEAGILQAAVHDLATPDNSKPTMADEIAHLDRKVHDASAALHAYEERLHETLLRKRDPDKGRQEYELIDALQRGIAKLQMALKSVSPVADPGGRSQSLFENEAIRQPIREIVLAAEQLGETISHDIYRRIDQGKGHYRHSLFLVVSTSVLGILLMAGLLRFFYAWVFYPVHDLQQGAGRVAQGDFDHRIEVTSGDEMEDLAAAFNDMTSRLSGMYRELEHQVNERSRQLVRSEHLASVGFLAAGVAHEINNPMASIAFCSEALESRLAELLEKAAEEDADVITKYLGMIHKAAFRCKEITQRLLEFSRGGERRREETDIGELIQNVLDLVEHLPNRKGKEIVFEPSCRIVAQVNGQEISSVILNLVVNALDSMEDGGVLAIGLAERDAQAELVFTDSGCGMTADVLENIFEPFFTRSRTGRGTGLGLSISHRIISQHGGEITAASAGLGHGSTFRVNLPIRAAEEGRVEKSRQAA